MHPYIGIVCTERWSDGLSTIRYGPNTLNFQFGGTNNASPGTQIGVPVTPHTKKEQIREISHQKRPSKLFKKLIGQHRHNFLWPLG